MGKVLIGTPWGVDKNLLAPPGGVDKFLSIPPGVPIGSYWHPLGVLIRPQIGGVIEIVYLCFWICILWESNAFQVGWLRTPMRSRTNCSTTILSTSITSSTSKFFWESSDNFKFVQVCLLLLLLRASQHPHISQSGWSYNHYFCPFSNGHQKHTWISVRSF